MNSLFESAKKVIPGGVNSPVRAFKSVGGTPVFMKRAKGAYIYDEHNKKYIDYCMSWGALILGHANPEIIESIKMAADNGTSFGTATKLEVDFANLIVDAIGSIEKVRLVNSGTEAVMSAVRLARAYTGKNNILKFEGAYHGHSDCLLAKSGSGITDLSIPDTPGVPYDFTKHTIIAPFNDIDKVKQIVSLYKDDLAAVIVEPVMANCGVILPEKGFLEFLRTIDNAVLIFDEVITGFRLGYGGAQDFFGIKPDLTCLGKIIGGAMPVGAFGGRADIMDMLAPEGNVYQAGTLSGNPVAVSAGTASLKILKRKDIYEKITKTADKLCSGIKTIAEDTGIQLEINRIGSVFSIFFTDNKVKNFNQAKNQNKKFFNRFFHSALDKNIYFSPSPFEANFLSCEHSDKDIDYTLTKIEKIFRKMADKV